MHTKTGTDRKGRFAIHYGGAAGIRWDRGEGAEQYFKEVQPPPAPRVGGVVSAMNAASGVVGSIAAVADAVASLLQWWELRQARLQREQRQETDQRLAFVGDLLDRWILEHSTTDHIDLKLSHYLARECLGLLGHAGDKDGVIVPMSLLYEIERVRQIIAAARATVVRQFLVVEGNGVNLVASPVEGEPPLHINYNALAPFFGSPEDEWNLAVANKKVKEFESDLQRLSRNPETIVARVFTVSPEQAQQLAVAISPTATLLRSAVLGAAVNVAKTVATYSLPGLAVLAVSAWRDRKNDERIERKDAVRELVLFAYEVEMTSLLVRAWNVLDQTIRASRGAGLLVLEETDGQPVIAARNDGGVFTPVRGDSLSTRLLPPLARASGSDALILPAGSAEAENIA